MLRLPHGNRGQVSEFLRSLSSEELDALLFHVPTEEANALRFLAHSDLARPDLVRSEPRRTNHDPRPIEPALEFALTRQADGSVEEADVADQELIAIPDAVPDRPLSQEDVCDAELTLSAPVESVDPVEQILRDTDSALLVRMLVDEHPQILAVVLSLLPPDRSAAVLGAFDEEAQTDTLRRMASMDPPDPETLAVLRCELMNQIAREVQSTTGRGDAWERVAAMVGSAAEPQREQLCESLAKAFPGLQQRLSRTSQLQTEADPDPVQPVREDGLRLLNRLTSHQLLQLVLRFGEGTFAIAVASGDDQVWNCVQARLPKIQSRRLASHLTLTGEISLSRLQALQAELANEASLLLQRTS